MTEKITVDKLYTKEQYLRLLQRGKESEIIRPRVKTPCWEYQGLLNDKGYGRIRFNKRDLYTHRAIVEINLNRYLSASEVVLHRCDNPRCFNPEHLQLGTILENNADRVEKDRSAKGESNGNSKLNEEKVIQIKLALHNNHNIARLAVKFGVGTDTIRAIRSGKYWNHVTLQYPEKLQRPLDLGTW